MKESLREKYPFFFKNKAKHIDSQRVYDKAWQQAHAAAEILKKKYGAKQVWIFGSLTDKERFNNRSDIDLAEIGIPDNRFYAAVAEVTREIKDIKIDIVDKENCRQVIKNKVDKEGIEI